MWTVKDLVAIARVSNRYGNRFVFDINKLAAIGVDVKMLDKAEEFIRRYEELDAEIAKS